MLMMRIHSQKKKCKVVIDTSKWIIEEANRQDIPPTRLFNRAKEIEDGIIPKLKEIVDKENKTKTL